MWNFLITRLLDNSFFSLDTQGINHYDTWKELWTCCLWWKLHFNGSICCSWEWKQIQCRLQLFHVAENIFVNEILKSRDDELSLRHSSKLLAFVLSRHKEKLPQTWWNFLIIFSSFAVIWGGVRKLFFTITTTDSVIVSGGGCEKKFQPPNNNAKLSKHKRRVESRELSVFGLLFEPRKTCINILSKAHRIQRVSNKQKDNKCTLHLFLSVLLFCLSCDTEFIWEI